MDALLPHAMPHGTWCRPVCAQKPRLPHPHLPTRPPTLPTPPGALPCLAPQGGETKRMFRVLGLQPGDALKLALQGKSSGIPTTRLTIIPAGPPRAWAEGGATAGWCTVRRLSPRHARTSVHLARRLGPEPSLRSPAPSPPAARNPHAAAILAQAAEQAAKRAERLAANPKAPKGQKKRKKVGQPRASQLDCARAAGQLRERCAVGRFLLGVCCYAKRYPLLGFCLHFLAANCLNCPACMAQAADDDDDDDEGFEGAPGEGCAAGRRMRPRSKKHFGEPAPFKARACACRLGGRPMLLRCIASSPLHACMPAPLLPDQATTL